MRQNVTLDEAQSSEVESGADDFEVYGLDGIDFLANLNEAERIAIRALLAGATKTEAARQAGVTRQTLYRWLKDEYIQAALDRERQETGEAFLEELRDLRREAFGAVRDVLRDPGSSPDLRLRAAKVLLGTIDPAAGMSHWKTPALQLFELRAQRATGRLRSQPG